MTQQMSLFPNSSLDILNRQQQKILADLDVTGNPVDEVFAASNRLRNSRNFMELLDFIARFPNYSAFNGLLLFIQDSSATYVATARTWLKKFGRQLGTKARPLVILAPMAPVRFVFDIRDTEGSPLPSDLLNSVVSGYQLSVKIYSATQLNCPFQGITVHETILGHDDNGATDRITPALRKQYNDLNIEKDTSYLIHLNKAQSMEERYSSLVHELGHIFCGHLGIDRYAWWAEREGLNINTEEIEADCVAYLVCRRKGLRAYADNFLSDYAGTNQEIPMFSLNAVLQAVSYVEEMGRGRWKEPRKRRRS
jgi:IrrE N-terminal-like domain